MKLGKLLFKPKWQEKDPAIRRMAVATENDPELLTAMPELARSDPDASVRLAALKRVNDYELWRGRSTGDVDPTLRRAARTAYMQQLCADLPGGPALARRIAEMETLSDEELEQVAISSTWRELRADALTRLRKPALFADRALNDPDAALRLEALHRIDDVALLDRVAERARKTDKIISRRARELADSRRVERGDATTIADRARLLCGQLETLMRGSGRDPDKLAAIEAEWKRLGGAIPAEIARRYEGARAVILAPPRKREEPTMDVPVVEPMALEPTQPVAPEPSPDVTVVPVAAPTKPRPALDEEKTRELQACIARFQAAVDAGDTAQAAKIHAGIDTLVADIEHLPPALHAALAPLREREAELQRWLHWSNNRRRKAICAEIETLSGTHPDALSNRLRELREEWQRLSTSTAAPPALEQRFHGLSHRLLRTARPYFDKREAVRRSHSEEVKQLLARADASSAEDGDSKTMLALRTELSAALRGLDLVDPRERSGFAKRIKAHIDRIGEHIAARDRDVEQAKAALIVRAEKLIETTDARDVAMQARSLQSQWTALGNGRRSTDQKQWRLFRLACDAAFGRLDEQRKEHDEKSAQQRAQAATIVEQLENIAASDAEPDILRTALRDAEAQWQSSSDRALEHRFREARDAISRSVKEAARKKRLRRFTSALRKYRLVRAVELGRATREALVEEWTQIGATNPDFDKALQARFESASDDGVDEDRAADALVRLEALAGIESPASERQRRMDLQVRRLSTRMRGGGNQEPDVELASLMAEWFALGQSGDATLDARFERAAQAVIDTLP